MSSHWLPLFPPDANARPVLKPHPRTQLAQDRALGLLELGDRVVDLAGVEQRLAELEPQAATPRSGRTPKPRREPCTDGVFVFFHDGAVDDPVTSSSVLLKDDESLVVFDEEDGLLPATGGSIVLAVEMRFSSSVFFLPTIALTKLAGVARCILI